MRLLARLAVVLGGFSLMAARGLALPHEGTSRVVLRSDDGKPLQGVDTPTGNPYNCTVPTKYFRQLVNHPKNGGYTPREDESTETDTFLQQYQMITDYFKPGGPIIFYQGAEGPETCLEYQVHLQYAMELGGIAVYLEHRFFGLSVPGNLSYEDNLEWPTEALESLTLDNVLLDAVAFIEWIKATVPGAEDSKAITFGGSYAAIISALERLRYPETFFAAFPTAGPFRGLVSDPNDPLIYSWANWVSNYIALQPKCWLNCLQVQQDLLDASPTATRKIEKALKDFREQLEAGNFEGMKEKLKYACAHRVSSISLTQIACARNPTVLRKRTCCITSFRMLMVLRLNIAMR